MLMSRLAVEHIVIILQKLDGLKSLNQLESVTES